MRTLFVHLLIAPTLSILANRDGANVLSLHLLEIFWDVFITAFVLFLVMTFKVYGLFFHYILLVRLFETTLSAKWSLAFYKILVSSTFTSTIDISSTHSVHLHYCYSAILLFLFKKPIILHFCTFAVFVWKKTINSIKEVLAHFPMF